MLFFHSDLLCVNCLVDAHSLYKKTEAENLVLDIRHFTRMNEQYTDIS